MAFQTIFSWDVNGASIEELVQFSWKKKDINADVRLFANLLVSGTIENLSDLDRLIEKSVKNWKLERLARVDLAILRIAVFEMLFQKDIPARVTINEAIEIAKSFGSDDSYKFVNGVLDNIRRTELN